MKLTVTVTPPSHCQAGTGRRPPPGPRRPAVAGCRDRDSRAGPSPRVTDMVTWAWHRLGRVAKASNSDHLRAEREDGCCGSGWQWEILLLSPKLKDFLGGRQRYALNIGGQPTSAILADVQPTTVCAVFFGHFRAAECTASRTVALCFLS